jgi:hypothetical protein
MNAYHMVILSIRAAIMWSKWEDKHPPISPSQQVWVGGIPHDMAENVFLRQLSANGIDPWTCKIRGSHKTGADNYAILTFKTDVLAKACLMVNNMMVGRGKKIVFLCLGLLSSSFFIFF